MQINVQILSFVKFERTKLHLVLKDKKRGGRKNGEKIRE